MRKLFLIILIAHTGLCYSQPTEDIPFKRFGFQAGVALSNMNFNLGVTHPDTTIKAAWKPGYTFGFLVRIPLTENLTLQPEYSYTRRYGKDNSVGIEYRFDYLSMPILLKYAVSEKFEFLAGPQLELLMNAHSDNQGDITHNVEERSIGVVGGVEYFFAENFFISARYMQGLNHIGVYQRTGNVKEYKYQLVSLTAGMRF